VIVGEYEARALRGEYGEMRRPDAHLKAIARAYANVYKQRGWLVAEPCEVCGTDEDIEMHHDDYSQPLAVRWLCRHHHNRLEF
jgi:hypothetical protein